MKNSFILLIIALSTHKFLLYAQCRCLKDSDEEPFYSYNTPNNQLIFCGYKEKESDNFIYASEFNIINCENNKTVLGFGALQNCKIGKNKSDLNIIEIKQLPWGKNFSWIETDYMKYVLKTNPQNKLFFDSVFVLNVPETNEEQKNKIYLIYNSLKENKSALTEDISYLLLLLSLHGDKKAYDMLINSKNLLNLDGEYARINTDAINIYNTIIGNRK